MKISHLIIFLLFAIVGGGVYWYQSTAAVCPVPLSYSLGEIDESFGLSSTTILSYIQEAEALWEDAVERELFNYDESANFRIHFVYDERQAEANSEFAQRTSLEEKKQKNDEILAIVESLQVEHQTLSESYQQKVLAYDDRLETYNQRVNRYNDRGGAPADIYTELEEERIYLNQESETLSRLAKELNALAQEINRLSQEGNRLVDEYNREVNRYNEAYGFTREFTQGDYQKGEIRVYKFSDTNELITVLAHEFGHALGIGHVEGGSSLMYYLLEDTNEPPVLSVDDIAGYQSVCGLTETTDQKVRRAVREFLLRF